MLSSVRKMSQLWLGWAVLGRNEREKRNNKKKLRAFNDFRMKMLSNILLAILNINIYICAFMTFLYFFLSLSLSPIFFWRVSLCFLLILHSLLPSFPIWLCVCVCFLIQLPCQLWFFFCFLELNWKHGKTVINTTQL